MTDAFPPELLDYLRNRLKQREDDVRQVMANMTPFERRLANEMAIMGWVRGYRAAGGDAAGFDERQKLPLVIDACLGMEDLYPVVAHLLAGGAHEAEAEDWMPEVQLP